MWMKWMRAAGAALVVFVAGCGKESKSTEAAKQTPAGGGQKTLANSSLGDTIARLHWLGMKQLAGETNATNFLAIWNLPETQKLELQTLDKLATAPWRLLLHQASTNALTPMAASPLLRPLLDDLVNAESYLEITQTTNQPGQLALAIRLDATRAGLWQTNLAAVLESLTGVKTTSGSVGGGAGFSLKKHHAPNLIELSRSGDWTVFGLAQENNSLLKQMVTRIEKEKNPFPARTTNFWVEAAVDPERIAQALPRLFHLPDGVAPRVPKITLSAIGDGQNVHTRGEFEFSQPLPFKLEPWIIPTNLIHDPLVGFTAIRGLGPLLDSHHDLPGTFGGPMPNQIFFWALDGTPLETYFAAAVADAGGRLANLTNLVMTKLNPRLEKSRLGTFEYSPTNGIVWGGVPLMSPFLRTAQLDRAEFVTGGMTADSRTNRPPVPAEMLQQILSTTNLVCYDWELTEPRMRDLLYIGQLVRLLFNRAQLPPKSAAIEWFRAAAPKLGNCATTVTFADPQRLWFNRESSAGFSAFELHAIGDWLESPGFPDSLHTLLATNAIPSARKHGTNSPTSNLAPAPGP